MSAQCDHDVRRYFDHLKHFNDRYAAQVESYRKLHQAAPGRRSPGLPDRGPSS